MDIEIRWSKPVELKKNPSRSRFLVDLGKIPAAGGVYFFARKHGNRLIPLYVGETDRSIRGRVKSHLDSVTKTERLLGGIELGIPRNGKRFLCYGTLEAKPGQQLKKCVKIVQDAMIQDALAAGHPLVNVSGTRVKSHTIRFGGNRTSLGAFIKTWEVPA